MNYWSRTGKIQVVRGYSLEGMQVFFEDHTGNVVLHGSLYCCRLEGPDQRQEENKTYRMLKEQRLMKF